MRPITAAAIACIATLSACAMAAAWKVSAALVGLAGSYAAIRKLHDDGVLSDAAYSAIKSVLDNVATLLGFKVDAPQLALGVAAAVVLAALIVHWIRGPSATKQERVNRKAAKMQEHRRG